MKGLLKTIHINHRHALIKINIHLDKSKVTDPILMLGNY